MNEVYDALRKSQSDLDKFDAVWNAAKEKNMTVEELVESAGCKSGFEYYDKFLAPK